MGPKQLWNFLQIASTPRSWRIDSSGLSVILDFKNKTNASRPPGYVSAATVIGIKDFGTYSVECRGCKEVEAVVLTCVKEIVAFFPLMSVEMLCEAEITIPSVVRRLAMMMSTDTKAVECAWSSDPLGIR